MKKSVIPAYITLFFAFLFVYAALSKLLDFENFQVQLAQSPLLNSHTGLISHSVIITELIVAIMLCIFPVRLAGLYLSLGLMVSFTTYIYLILNYSEFVPCSCGGILENLDWTEHLIFNISCIIFAIVGIFLMERQKRVNMLKPALYTLSVCVISCSTIIAWHISSEHLVEKENGFIRRFIQYPVIKDNNYNLGVNSFYFAGTYNDKIYLGNYTNPLVLTEIDSSLNKISQIKIQLSGKNYPFRNLQVQVKSSYFYLYDGSVPIIYRGNITDSTADIISFNDAYFTELIILDSTKFALKTQSSHTQDYTLASLSLQDSPKVRLRPSILEKQIDGVFDVDGKLIQNQDASKLIYTYAYRNQFIVMDSSLQVLQKYNTIDTTSKARISTIQLSNGTHKMNKPPLKVNNVMTANRNLLLNQSNLKGSYESSDAWRRAYVVDIYRTDKVEYIGSFYLDHKTKNNPLQMLLTDYYLYTLTGQDLIRHKLRAPIAKYFATKKL